MSDLSPSSMQPMNAALPSAASAFPPPTPEECGQAVLAHALQMAGWWIAPLVIFLINRKSRFVSFHALQALLWQALLLMLSIAAAVAFIATIFARMPELQRQPATAPPPEFFLLFPLLWLGGMAIWIINLVLTIVYAVKASRGQWAGYPLFGALARYILGIS